jgi:RNA polymerase sigma-70 factor (ECF subfamily)
VEIGSPGANTSFVASLARRLHSLGENDLVPLAIAGNDAAFTRLYRRHARSVASALYRLVGTDVDLDAVMVETFVEARRDLVRLREPTHLRGWLMQLALRHLVRRAEPSSQPRVEVELADVVWRNSPVVWGAAASVVSQLRAAIVALPKPIRVAYALHRLGEVPMSTIGEIMGVGIRDVRRRIWAGERRLRRQNLSVIADRVRLDADVPWHDLREMRVLTSVRAVPIVRTGFAAIREAQPTVGESTRLQRVARFGALVACSSAVLGFGAWLGPLMRSIGS